MKEKDKEKILKVITNALGLKERIKEDDTMDTVQEWDSLGHITVLTALDKEFEGRLADVQGLAGVSSVRGIFTLLEKEGII